LSRYTLSVKRSVVTTPVIRIGSPSEADEDVVAVEEPVGKNIHAARW
jgi:hypothetical protein